MSSVVCGKFSLLEIKDATANFEKVLGKGGEGTVYLGRISSLGSVAVKRLEPSLEFEQELEIFSAIRHPNLVSLHGHCEEFGEKILVYEYMGKGSLADYILKKSSPVFLSWQQRLNICIGAAHGLRHLHTPTGTFPKGIIHRDIKPANILLDDNWVAKVSDFGMCKLSLANQNKSTMITQLKGTSGYFAPEYITCSSITRMVDVYAFGVVLFEILCQKNPWVRDNESYYRREDEDLGVWALENVDSQIKDEITKGCLETFTHIIGRSLQLNPRKRPTMNEVVMGLEYARECQECDEDQGISPKAPIRSGDISDFDEVEKMHRDNYDVKAFKVKDTGLPQDVIDVFMLYSRRNSRMTVDQFLRFLVEFQGMLCTISDAKQIVKQVLNHRYHFTMFRRPLFSLDDFYYYLCHFLCHEDMNVPTRIQVHHDMTAPLHHYFIYTSHNSYLIGNQLSSDCSEIPIITALERGVRAIELDLWPNVSKDNISVMHGRTLAIPVPLVKCFKSIKEHAFVRSPYPVIITLENHLTPSLQAKVAEMVIQIFGEMLYHPDSECEDDFPSPDDLKYRIILSTKPPKEYLESKALDKESNSTLEEDSSEEDFLVKKIADFNSELEAEENSDPEDEDGEIYNQISGQLGAPEYKRLIAIHAAKPKKGLRQALRVETGKARSLSLSEQALKRAASLYGTHVVRFTQKNFLRVYPKGTRVTPSNFYPLTGWILGAQMVAFNMQCYGNSLWMMHGMFRSNGGCGYVKKPDFLMQTNPDNKVFDPKEILPVKTILKVKIYMGNGWLLDFSRTHFDTYSPPDFYAKVYIVGMPADYAKKETKVVEDDWTPSWDEEFSFPLTVPELALLRIVVMEYSMLKEDKFGGQTCLPVSELGTGIRTVPLYDMNGEKYRSVKLLMRFQFV